MEENLSRRERYERSKKARDDAAKQNSGYTPYEVPEFEALVLEQDKCHVLRLVGEVPELRKNSLDALVVERSMVRSDDGKYFNMIWHPDKNWPFRVLARKLCKYKYEDTGAGSKMKVYENAGCELLQYFNTNGKENPSPFESGMNSSKYVLINAIDRMDDWCVKNKHTKMVAWDVNEVEDKKYYTWGMKAGLFNEIFNVKCNAVQAHYEEFDLVLRRFSQNKKPKDDVYYQVMYNEEKKVIENWSIKDKIDYASFISDNDDLTPEEKKYERYSLENIPFISMPTPMGVIMNKMGDFIKKIDKKYNWGIWEMMVEWNAKEKEEAKKNEKSEDTTNKSSVTLNSEDEDLPTSVEEKPTKTSKTPKMVKKGIEFTEEMLDAFSGLKKCPEHIHSHIVDVNVDTMEITFDLEADVLCGNEECGMEIPDSFDYCPYCGTNYPEE